MRKKFFKQDIDISQEDLINSALELAAEEDDKLLCRFKTKEFNKGSELLKESITKPFDGKELTDSVKEHDELFLKCVL